MIFHTKFILTVFFLLSATFLHARPLIRSVESLPDDIHSKTRCLNKEYLLFSPTVAESKNAIPLFIYLHGAGGKGEDIAIAEKRSRLAIDNVQNAIDEPFFIVAPQALKREGAGWFSEDLNIWLGHLKSTLPIDENRIYLTGHSMGGYGTWLWAGKNPEHFAAVAPSAGGIGPGGPLDISTDWELWAKNLIKVPLWAFHGADDNVVPAERSEMMVEAIKKHGGNKAKLTVYPGVKHNSNQKTHTNPELYKWLFSHRR